MLRLSLAAWNSLLAMIDCQVVRPCSVYQVSLLTSSLRKVCCSYSELHLTVQSWLQSPEHPKTPPQTPPATPSSTRGPLTGNNGQPNSQTFNAASTKKGNNSKGSGGKPSSHEQTHGANAYKVWTTAAKIHVHDQYRKNKKPSISTQRTTTLPPASKTAVRLVSGFKPLVGSKVAFHNKIQYYKEHQCFNMVKKLKGLSHLTARRSTRGKPLWAVYSA